MEDYIGMIRMFAGNYAPRNYLPCNGGLLSIAQFPSLFHVLGTLYGGDGRTTFALPDFRGRVPLSAGQGPNLSDYVLGAKEGEESVTLVEKQMPAHNHLGTIAALTNTDKARGSFWSYNSGGGTSWGTEASTNTLNGDAITSAGSSEAHTNIQPYQCVYFIIRVIGTIPPPPEQPSGKDDGTANEITEEDKK